MLLSSEYSFHFRPDKECEGVTEIEKTFTADGENDETDRETQEKCKNSGFWGRLGEAEGEGEG